VHQVYADALAWLEAVAAGRLPLAAESAAAPSAAIAPAVHWAGNKRVFTADELDGL
jgi:phage gp36-like protein